METNETKDTTKEELNNDKKYTISFLDIILVLARRWKMIIGISGLSAVAVLIAMIISIALPAEKSFLPNRFSPDAKILFRENSSSMGGLGEEGGALLALAGIQGGTTSNKSDKAEVILYTRELLDVIIDKHNLIEKFELQEADFAQSQARSSIKNNISVDFDSKSSVMTIKYTDIDKNFATEILKSLLDELEKRYRFFEEETVEENITDLQNSIVAAEEEFNTAQQNLIDYSKNFGIINLDMQAEYTVREIASLNNQILSKEIEINKILEYKKASDPEIIQKKKELKQLKNLLQQRKTGFTEFSVDSLAGNKLAETLANYNKLKLELQQKGQLYYTLKTQLASSRLKLYAESSSFQIIDRPEVPEIKASPSRAKICILVVFAMGFLSIFLAFVLEYGKNLKEDPEESAKLKEIRLQFRSKRYKKKHGLIE